MARHLLRDLHHMDDLLLDHQYVFELESWLYIFIHVVTSCVDVVGDHPLRKWHNQNWDAIHSEKEALFSNGVAGFEFYLDLTRNFYKTENTGVYSVLSVRFQRPISNQGIALSVYCDSSKRPLQMQQKRG